MAGMVDTLGRGLLSSFPASLASILLFLPLSQLNSKDISSWKPSELHLVLTHFTAGAELKSSLQEAEVGPGAASLPAASSPHCSALLPSDLSLAPPGEFNLQEVMDSTYFFS